MYRHRQGTNTFIFRDLKDLMAKATPLRSADVLAGIAAESEQQRIAAQMLLADLPLDVFVNQALIPYEEDDVTRMIFDDLDQEAFGQIKHLTVGGFRDWLLAADAVQLAAMKYALTPEMVAAVAKIMRAQDLMLVSSRIEVITGFRSTLGLRGRFSTRLQPNHPTDDPRGILASTLDGLSLGCGDAVIGINPALDRVDRVIDLLKMLDDLRAQLAIPTQTCVLSHVTTTMQAIAQGAPVDLVFQSIAGSEKANASFGMNLAMLDEANQAALSLNRWSISPHVMYFETGQGSALSANAHHGVDAHTMECRAYAAARRFSPLLVNTVVGFIGPEYLCNGKQIIRAGLEDHFAGKLLGLPMGCDVCYTNHADADQDDMDILLTTLAAAGCTYIMGVPGGDDVMLNYQSTAYHDALYIRRLLGRKPTPEFEQWLEQMGIWDSRAGRLLDGVSTLGKLLPGLGV